MDTKKIQRLLEKEKRPQTVQVNLNINKEIYERMQARYPRNSQPSLSKVTETLWSEFLDSLGKGKK